jgi:hypothetical protein
MQFFERPRDFYLLNLGASDIDSKVILMGHEFVKLL